VCIEIDCDVYCEFAPVTSNTVSNDGMGIVRGSRALSLSS
jgi:hypothetical protein